MTHAQCMIDSTHKADGGIHVEKQVTLPLDALKMLVSMAESHLEDIESGLEEGLYEESENEGIGDMRAALEVCLAACEKG